MRFKSYEHLTTTVRTDARRSLVTVLKISVLAMLKSINMQNFDPNIPCSSRVMSIFIKTPRPAWQSLRFAYQWLRNVEINKYAKFAPNIPKMGSYACQTLDNATFIRTQHLIKICDVHQELQAFSLTANGWTDRRTDRRMDQMILDKASSQFYIPVTGRYLIK